MGKEKREKLTSFFSPLSFWCDPVIELMSCLCCDFFWRIPSPESTIWVYGKRKENFVKVFPIEDTNILAKIEGIPWCLKFLSDIQRIVLTNSMTHKLMIIREGERFFNIIKCVSYTKRLRRSHEYMNGQVSLLYF